MSEDMETGLTEGQITGFIEDGFVCLAKAFPAELAQECRAELWREMRLSPDKPEGWIDPVRRLAWKSTAPFVAAGNTPMLHRAYDQLAGTGRWHRPTGLGSLVVRFPSVAATGDDGWHVDMSFGDSPDFMEWRVNVKSSHRALLMLFLLSDVGPKDAPTRIRKGSHRIIARELLPYGGEGASLRQLSAENYVSTTACEEALATGPAGTVYLCHPFLVHAAQAHRGAVPRFLAQPPLRPVAEFDPALPPSPVQMAIRQACGLA
ncbi:phytanoyl-CoA dioxygenase family protein, partial [Neogemmobacter tilapiae]